MAAAPRLLAAGANAPALPRGRRRALLAPTLATAIAFGLLLGLGGWQLQRRQWKLAILAEVDRAEASAPVPLPQHPLPFTKVTVTGRLRTDVHALYGAEVRDTPGGGSAMGAGLIEPLERPGQDPVLVDRGWVPDGQSGAPGGGEVVGYVRAPDTPGTFSAPDDVAGRHFYTLDPARIGAALGLPRVAPFTLVALGPTDSIPSPAAALPRPPNDHLNYALTWFGLAAALLAVYAAYCRKVLRRSLP